MMSDDGKLTLVGTCGEISERNGWTAFAINVPGKQYPVKLSTKMETIIDAARAVGGELATWTYKESQGGENPNRPGTFYTNRYLEGVTAGATAEAQAASSAGSTASSNAGGSPAVQAHHPLLHEADRQRAILRQSCIKAAGWIYATKATLPPNDPNEEWLDDVPLAVMNAAARFEQWVVRDLAPDDSIPF